MKNSITASPKANVMSFENESTGSLFSLKWSKHRYPIVEEAGDSDSNDAQLQEFSDALNTVIILDISENVLLYIAGFIVQKLKRQVDCSICSEALLLNSSPSASSEFRKTPSHELVLERRNNGGLIKVSYNVYRTIKYAEQTFQHTVKGNGEMKINKENNLIKKMTNHVIVTNGPRIQSFFPSLQGHRLENDRIIEDDRLTQLIKQLCHRFLLIRMQTYAKRYNRQVIVDNTPRIRH